MSPFRRSGFKALPKVCPPALLADPQVEAWRNSVPLYAPPKEMCVSEVSATEISRREKIAAAAPAAAKKRATVPPRPVTVEEDESELPVLATTVKLVKKSAAAPTRTAAAATTTTAARPSPARASPSATTTPASAPAPSPTAASDWTPEEDYIVGYGATNKHSWQDIAAKVGRTTTSDVVRRYIAIRGTWKSLPTPDNVDPWAEVPSVSEPVAPVVAEPHIPGAWPTAPSSCGEDDSEPEPPAATKTPAPEGALSAEARREVLKEVHERLDILAADREKRKREEQEREREREKLKEIRAREKMQMENREREREKFKERREKAKRERETRDAERLKEINASRASPPAPAPSVEEPKTSFQPYDGPHTAPKERGAYPDLSRPLPAKPSPTAPAKPAPRPSPVFAEKPTSFRPYDVPHTSPAKAAPRSLPPLPVPVVEKPTSFRPYDDPPPAAPSHASRRAPRSASIERRPQTAPEQRGRPQHREEDRHQQPVRHTPRRHSEHPLRLPHPAEEARRRSHFFEDDHVRDAPRIPTPRPSRENLNRFDDLATTVFPSDSASNIQPYEAPAPEEKQYSFFVEYDKPSSRPRSKPKPYLAAPSTRPRPMARQPPLSKTTDKVKGWFKKTLVPGHVSCKPPPPTRSIPMARDPTAALRRTKQPRIITHVDQFGKYGPEEMSKRREVENWSKPMGPRRMPG